MKARSLKIPSVERHLGDLARRDDVSAGRGLSIEQRDRCLHVYALADGANLEYHVEPCGLADGESKCSLARHLEAGLFDSYFVSSRREAGDGVLTFRAGARSADLIRADVADTDGRLDHTRATRIGDSTDESRGRSLRRDQAGEQTRQQTSQRQRSGKTKCHGQGVHCEIPPREHGYYER